MGALTINEQRSQRRRENANKDSKVLIRSDLTAGTVGEDYRLEDASAARG